MPRKRSAAFDSPPEDFEPGSRGRCKVWRSLPLAVRKYINTLAAQRRDTSPTARRKQDLEALADEAWAGRYKGAHEYKVRVLQRAHSLALERLQAAWFDGEEGARAATRPRSATIYSLSSDVLENIIERVLVSDPEAPERSNSVLPKCDAGWGARRSVAQVSRLFEALASRCTASVCCALAPPSGWLPAQAPPGFLGRELERATFSSQLSRIELFIPTSGAGGEGDFETAAAALVRCAAITELTLAVESAAAGDATIPAVLADALGRCQKLSSLPLAAFQWSSFRTAQQGTAVKLSQASVEQLSQALTTLTRLTKLHITGCDLLASDTFLPALEQMRAVQELCFRTTATAGWMRLLAVPSLTKLELDHCYRWDSSRGEVLPERDDIAGSSRLKELALCTTLDADGLSSLVRILPQLIQASKLMLHGLDSNIFPSSTLAKALPRMPSLRALSLFDASHDVLEQLPRCKQLDDVCVEFYMPPDDQMSITALGSALAACPVLRRLELVVHRYDGDTEIDFPELPGLFGSLAACRKLQHLVVRGTWGMRDLCALSLELPTYNTLESLTIDGIEDEDMVVRDVMTALVERTPRVALRFRL